MKSILLVLFALGFPFSALSFGAVAPVPVPTTITLTWHNNTPTAEVLIERALDTVTPYAQIAIVPPGVSTYVDSALLPGTVYGYRVRARVVGKTDPASISPYSNISLYTTPAPSPLAPDSLKAAGTLVNVSTRGAVGTGDDVLIAGFVVERGPVTVLVRAVGPGMSAVGLTTGTLADPRVRVVKDGVDIASNDDWGGDAAIIAAQSQTGAFALAGDSRDAALIATLEPGLYTAIVSGADGGTGLALVEAYSLSR
jgi:hypothetical protein